VESSISPSYIPVIANCWHIKTSPKIQVFIWKCLKGAVAVSDRLLTRGIHNSDGCLLCGAEKETINHLLFFVLMPDKYGMSQISLLLLMVLEARSLKTSNIFFPLEQMSSYHLKLELYFLGLSGFCGKIGTPSYLMELLLLQTYWFEKHLRIPLHGSRLRYHFLIDLPLLLLNRFIGLLHYGLN